MPDWLPSVIGIGIIVVAGLLAAFWPYIIGAGGSDQDDTPEVR